MKYAALALIALLLLMACQSTAHLEGGHSSVLLRLTHHDIQRTAIVHRPPTLPAQPGPVVILLHGLGSTGRDLQRDLGFDRIANRETIITVYPDAWDNKWNFGRPVIGPMPQGPKGPIDDVGFIDALVDRLIKDKTADPNRVFVFGVSRGGIMAFTLACTLPHRIAGFAAAIASMTKFQVEDCRPSRPASIFILAGTADPLQPFDGWPADERRVLPVPETVAFWHNRAQCQQQQNHRIPHRSNDDPTRVEVAKWSGCRDDVAIHFVKVIGGGHQIPSLAAPKSPPSPEKGLQNRDVEAIEDVWTFFKSLASAARRF